MNEKLRGAQKFVDARVRVRYAETDQMGVVYHANYLVWFEVGRVEMIRQMGISYKDMEGEDGCADRGGGCDGTIQGSGAV